MDFLNLKSAVTEGVSNQPMSAEEIKAALEQKAIDDRAALTIVLNDVRIAEAFVQSKNLSAEWDSCDNAFRAYVPEQSWPGDSTKKRANLPMPVVMEAIESLLPQAFMAFFSDPQPFLLKPKGRTSPRAARAMAKIVSWAIDKSGFPEEIRKILKSCFVYGMGIAKWGWKRTTHVKKVYKVSDGQVEQDVKEIEISLPTVEWVDLRNVLVDSGTRSHNIKEANQVIHQTYILPSDLVLLEDDYDNVPSKDELARILVDRLMTAAPDSFLGIKYKSWRENQAEFQNLPTSVDPLKQPLEILEWHSDDRVITILERCIVLRNEPADACITKPFRSCAFIDVLNSFYGFGVAKLLAGEQALQTGVMGAYVDGLNLRMFPMWHRKKGQGTTSQKILTAPGKVINDDGELAPLEMPDSASAEALQAVSTSEQRASRRVGSNFGSEMPTQAMRTAEGVNQFTAGVQIRLQYFIENFAQLVFIPLIQAFIDMCKDNLTPDQINEILTDAEGKAYEGDLQEIYNGEFMVDVLSSTKLAGRRAMQALIPLFLQLFGQPAITSLLGVQGKKVDFDEFLEEVGEITGWDVSNFIVDMTPEDQQRQMMSNPAVVNAQAKQQQQQQGQKDQLEQIQAKGEANIATAVVKHVMKDSSEQRKNAAELAAMSKPLANQPRK